MFMKNSGICGDDRRTLSLLLMDLVRMRSLMSSLWSGTRLDPCDESMERRGLVAGFFYPSMTYWDIKP